MVNRQSFGSNPTAAADFNHWNEVWYRESALWGFLMRGWNGRCAAPIVPRSSTDMDVTAAAAPLLTCPTLELKQIDKRLVHIAREQADVRVTIAQYNTPSLYLRVRMEPMCSIAFLGWRKKEIYPPHTQTSLNQINVLSGIATHYAVLGGFLDLGNGMTKSEIVRKPPSYRVRFRI
jgi:hypothetical protein